MWIYIQLILIVYVESACLNFTSGEPYPIDESSYCGTGKIINRTDNPMGSFRRDSSRSRNPG